MILTEEQELIREAAAELAKTSVAPLAEEADRDCIFPKTQIKAAAEIGMLLLKHPEEFGGSGGDNVSYVLFIEELAKACTSTALSVSVQSLCADCINLFGTNEQKSKYLPLMASGDCIAAFAMTEADAGTDAAAQATSATDNGSHYLLNGSKSYITNGSAADIAIVLARTNPESTGGSGISMFIVEKDHFKTGEKYNQMGLRAAGGADLIFENAEIPKDCLLGLDGQGLSNAKTVLDPARMATAAIGTGLIQACIEESISYGENRVQFGKPVIQNQALRWMLADMYKDSIAARQMTWHTAALADIKRKFTAQASAAKLFASEAAMNVAVNAVQIHGGYGYCKPAKVERIFRDAKALAISEGTSEAQKMIISSDLLK